jgi:alkyl sulfatase BDS1-like metallo-beta-lactamase superfamily hydrolase
MIGRDMCSMLLKMLAKQAEITDLLGSPEITKVHGSLLDLGRFFALLDKPDLVFPIVTPKQ